MIGTVRSSMATTASSEGQVVAEAFRRERLRDNLSRLIDSDDDVEAVAIKLGAQHPNGLSHCNIEQFVTRELGMP